MVRWCLMIFDGFCLKLKGDPLPHWSRASRIQAAAAQLSSKVGVANSTFNMALWNVVKKKATWTCFDQKILETIHVPGLAYMWECPMFRCVQVFWEIICSAICVRIELLAVAFSTIRFQARLKREKFLLRAQIRPELRIGERWARQEEESPLCQTGSNMTWPFTNASTITVRLLFLMIPK